MEISIEAVESLIARGKRTLAGALAPQKKALGFQDEQ
jgi:RNA polymerase sigma-70 factor (ECF subfamily)